VGGAAETRLGREVRKQLILKVHAVSARGPANVKGVSAQSPGLARLRLPRVELPDPASAYQWLTAFRLDAEGSGRLLTEKSTRITRGEYPPVEVGPKS
jgi:hypothetical protein